MSLFRRRLIFILFLAFFLTIAPLLILYASGYRFDWTHRTIYKTGLLIVEYTPRDASFSLDGVVMDTHSPMRLSGLAPRSYLLRITKDGYIPWEKRLWVPEYITTFVRHVSLFRAAAPTNLEATVALSAPHPREPLIAASVRTTAGERAALITKDAMTPIAVVPTFSRIRRLAWSAHGKYLLVLGDLGGNRVGSIVTMQPTPTAFPLTTIVRNPLSSLTWDTSDDDQLIGYGNEKGAVWLYRIAVASRRAERSLVPSETTTLPLLARGDRMILLMPSRQKERREIPGTTMVFRPFSDTRNSVEQRVTLPTVNRPLTIRDEHRNLITVTDAQAATIYLVEREPRSTTPIVETFSNVLGSAWSLSNNRLVYWNAQEVFVWDLEQNTKERVLRSDDPIARVFWHPKNEYLFVQSKKAITVLEIDGRDRRNTVPLVTGEGIQNSGIDGESAWLWVQTKEGIAWYELQ